MLAPLPGCDLRRAELLELDLDCTVLREGRWVIPDLLGKGNRRRTVPMPAAVKQRGGRLGAAGNDRTKPSGKLFRPTSKAGMLADEAIVKEKRDLANGGTERELVLARRAGSA